MSKNERNPKFGGPKCKYSIVDLDHKIMIEDQYDQLGAIWRLKE